MKSLDLDTLAKDILDNLRAHGTDIVSPISMSSPRAIGDAVQAYLADYGMPAVMASRGIDINSGSSRRSMEDLAFTDADGNYYAVDVKTHNTATVFNMPNLISVKRLSTFYRNDDRNHFCILIVAYTVEDGAITYTDCHFKTIESLSWDCLTFGALGWGQIQIANSNNLVFNPNPSRKEWMLTLCDRIALFYDEEIAKIGERKRWFDESRTFWQQHA